MLKVHPKQFSRMIFGLMLGSVCAAASTGTVTPDADGQWKIKCECLTRFDLCESEFFATAAGKPTHSWYQDIFVTKGVPADLNAACYRKRDTGIGGLGACCSISGDEAATIKNLFSGTKY
jgi:hypothetical protein